MFNIDGNVPQYVAGDEEVNAKFGEIDRQMFVTNCSDECNRGNLVGTCTISEGNECSGWVGALAALKIEVRNPNL